jgi:hypothetical protein
MMTMPISENAVGPNDKIVRRLDDFPELMQALRGGDLLGGRLVCAQLFDFHRSAKFGDASATRASLKSRA